MKAESKCPIDAGLIQCPDCGQVLGPVTPDLLQGTAWPYHALYSLRHLRVFGIAGDTDPERIPRHQTPPG